MIMREQSDYISPWYKIRKFIIIIFIIIAIAIGGYFIYNNYFSESKKYDDAIKYLNEGDYIKSEEIFNNIIDYKKSVDFVSEIEYEKIIFKCINDYKSYMKNPDSLIIKDIAIYSLNDGEADACIMTISGQNGFGGMTTSCVLFSISSVTNDFKYVGSSTTLDETSISKYDDDYVLKTFIIKTMKNIINDYPNIGQFNIERINNLIKNDVKVIINDK